MKPLFEIHSDIKRIESEMEAWAIEHEGDVTDFPLGDKLESLEMEKQEKILAIAKYIKNIDAEASMLKSESDRMVKRHRAVSAKKERLKEYLKNFAEKGINYQDEQVVVSWRKSEQVYIDPAAKPEQMKPSYTSVKVDFNKTAIKEALKSGEDVEFCEIRTNHNIQIK